MAIVYEVSRGCTGCGTCVTECPVQAISMTVTGGAQIDPRRCVGCGACQENCASEAIVAVGAVAVAAGSSETQSQTGRSGDHAELRVS